MGEGVSVGRPNSNGVDSGVGLRINPANCDPPQATKPISPTTRIALMSSSDVMRRGRRWAMGAGRIPALAGLGRGADAFRVGGWKGRVNE